MSSGSAASVIARLEKDLRDLWKPSEDPTAPPVSRVCTMNLEVVAPSTALLERYAPVVDEVTASIPARAILAALEPDAGTDAIDGSATAVCRPFAGGKICSERIVLSCRGKAAARAASAIEAFLVPEIPTALVWLGRVRVDDPVFDNLASDAQRIILDSEYTSIASVIQTVAWARKQRNGPEIADLAWTRIAVWQELLARFFDGVDARPLAHKLTKVSLTQACDPGARIGPEAALMLGWMGTRLGWSVARANAMLHITRADGTPVAVELGAVPRPNGVAPHTLARLSVEAGEDASRPALRGTIERDLASGPKDQADTTLDADVMLWRSARTDATEIEQTIRLGANKAAKWLERTLHRPLRDPAFDESVAFAERVVAEGLTVS